MPLTQESDIERLRSRFKSEEFFLYNGSALTDMRPAEMLQAFHNILHRACHLDRYKNGALSNQVTLRRPLHFCFEDIHNCRAVTSAERDVFDEGLPFIRRWSERFQAGYVTKPYEMIAAMGSYPSDIKKVFNDDNVSRGLAASFCLSEPQELGRADTRGLGFTCSDLIRPPMNLNSVGQLAAHDSLVGLVKVQGAGGELLLSPMGARAPMGIGSTTWLPPSAPYMLTNTARASVRDNSVHVSHVKESDEEGDEDEETEEGDKDTETKGDDEEVEGDAKENTKDKEEGEKEEGERNVAKSTGEKHKQERLEKEGLEKNAKRWVDSL